MSTVTRWIADKPLRGHGTFVLHLNIGTIAAMGSAGVDRRSGVFATITELGNDPHPPTFPYPVDVPFIGAAHMSIRNVAPRDDGVVDLLVQVDWPYDLYLGIQILVCND
jgi:hypothetical protein